MAEPHRVRRPWLNVEHQIHVVATRGGGFGESCRWMANRADAEGPIDCTTP